MDSGLDFPFFTELYADVFEELWDKASNDGTERVKRNELDRFI